METLEFEYTFEFANGYREVFQILLNSETLEPAAPLPEDLPDWARLEFRQCEHCPLKSETHAYCPPAARLVPLISRFQNVLSYSEVKIEARSPERTVTKEASAQVGVGSVMGLVMATSGCPYTAIFKPMARYHLPFATVDETIYRVASMYFFAQYFMWKSRGDMHNWGLSGLQQIYEKVEIMNRDMADRIRTAVTGDAALNAIVELDFFGKNIFFELEDQFIAFEHMFKSYIDDANGPEDEEKD